MSMEAFKAIMSGVKEVAADVGKEFAQELGNRVSEAKEFAGIVASDIGSELVHQSAVDSFAQILDDVRRDLTPDDRRAGDVIAEMSPDERVRGFHSLVESRIGSAIHREDQDGEHRTWNDLSPPGKLSAIASDAAYYDVPPEASVAAAKERLGDDILDASLKVAFQNERELTAIARALPDHNGIDPPPLVEQVKDVVGELEHAQGFIGRQDQGRER